jgi:hypothetical protein
MTFRWAGRPATSSSGALSSQRAVAQSAPDSEPARDRGRSQIAGPVARPTVAHACDSVGRRNAPLRERSTAAQGVRDRRTRNKRGVSAVRSRPRRGHTRSLSRSAHPDGSRRRRASEFHCVGRYSRFGHGYSERLFLTPGCGRRHKPASRRSGADTRKASRPRSFPARAAPRSYAPVSGFPKHGRPAHDLGIAVHYLAGAFDTIGHYAKMSSGFGGSPPSRRMSGSKAAKSAVLH